MANQTNITPPRVPVIDEKTGLISRDWYRFFLNLFVLTGGGTNDTSLVDLQVQPLSNQGQSADFELVYDQAQLAAIVARQEQLITNLQSQVDATPAQPQLGTIAAENKGASGTFTTTDSKTVTVVNGVITKIV
jgi:hypothetical protein